MSHGPACERPDGGSSGLGKGSSALRTSPCPDSDEGEGPRDKEQWGVLREDGRNRSWSDGDKIHC